MRCFLLVCLFFATSYVMAKDMSKVLVVIDMQKGFATSHSSILHIQKLIKEFKENERPILFVKYKGYGDVFDDLADLAKDYEFKFEIEKSNNDGSQEVMDFFQQSKLNPSFMTIVGLNTCVCVAETVLGLNNKIGLSCSSSITVDPQGCHCHGHGARHNLSIGKVTFIKRCLSKNEIYRKFENLSNVGVKSVEKAPKRKQTKNIEQIKKIIINVETFKALKDLKADFINNTVTPGSVLSLNEISEFILNELYDLNENIKDASPLDRLSAFIEIFDKSKK